VNRWRSSFSTYTQHQNITEQKLLRATDNWTLHVQLVQNFCSTVKLVVVLKTTPFLVKISDNGAIRCFSCEMCNRRGITSRYALNRYSVHMNMYHTAMYLIEQPGWCSRGRTFHVVLHTLVIQELTHRYNTPYNWLNNRWSQATTHRTTDWIIGGVNTFTYEKSIQCIHEQFEQWFKIAGRVKLHIFLHRSKSNL